MSAYRAVEIACDHFGCVVTRTVKTDPDDDTATAARREAIDHGWSISMAIAPPSVSDFCPFHSAEGES